MPKKTKKSTKKDKGEQAKKKKGKQGERAKKGKKAKKVKDESPEKSEEPGSQDNSGAHDYWDEEDELEEYIMKKDLGQIKDDSGAGGSSAGSDSEGVLLHLPCSVSKGYMMKKDLGHINDDSNAGGSSAGGDSEGMPLDSHLMPWCQVLWRHACTSWEYSLNYSELPWTHAVHLYHTTRSLSHDKSRSLWESSSASVNVHSTGLLIRMLLCPIGGAAGSDKEEGAGSDEDEEGPGDAKQLAAETQRVLRGAVLTLSETAWLKPGSLH